LVKKLKIIAPYDLMGQMEMKCIFDIGKKYSILAKATQVSDVAHGPLVEIISPLKRTWPFI
jgi:hypothetical protein